MCIQEHSVQLPIRDSWNLFRHCKDVPPPALLAHEAQNIWESLCLLSYFVGLSISNEDGSREQSEGCNWIKAFSVYKHKYLEKYTHKTQVALVSHRPFAQVQTVVAHVTYFVAFLLCLGLRVDGRVSNDGNQCANHRCCRPEQKSYFLAEAAYQWYFVSG